MKAQDVHLIISDYCRWNQFQKLSNLLEENNNIDIIYGNGILFRVAISNDSIEMLRVLLEYFKKNYLITSV